MPPGDAGWFLVVFRSQMAADGFVEEDGEVWSADGRSRPPRQLLLMHQSIRALPTVGRACDVFCNWS